MVLFKSFIDGEDYMSIGLDGVISAGENELCLPITILNDTIPENCVESFTLTLESSDALIGSPSQAQIQILDDDGM